MILKMIKNEKLIYDSVHIHYREMNHKIDQIIKIVNSQVPFFLGELEEQVFQIDIADIYYFESVDKTVFLYTKDAVYKTKETLKSIEECLNQTQFIRISKSVIVNVYKIKSIKTDVSMRLLLNLHNKEVLLASRHYRQALFDLIKNLDARRSL